MASEAYRTFVVYDGYVGVKNLPEKTPDGLTVYLFNGEVVRFGPETYDNERIISWFGTERFGTGWLNVITRQGGLPESELVSIPLTSVRKMIEVYYD